MTYNGYPNCKLNRTKHSRHIYFRKDSIMVGDHVWVGGEVVILPNSHIGKGSICGYRAVIKGTFPNNCMIGGIPGRILKKDVAWMRENICLDENMIYKLPQEYRERTELI